MTGRGIVEAVAVAGLNMHEAGRKLGSSVTAIRPVKKAAALLQPNATPERKTGSERKRKTHTETGKVTKHLVMRDPFLMAKKSREIHADMLGEASVQTIHHQLQIQSCHVVAPRTNLSLLTK